MKKKDEIVVKVPLEVRLTEDELKSLAKQMAGAVAKSQRLENELEDFRTQKKAEITATESIIAQCCQIINSEKEFRLVECRVEYDFGAGKKNTYRLDNGEHVREESVTNEERQTMMPGAFHRDRKSQAAGE